MFKYTIPDNELNTYNCSNSNINNESDDYDYYDGYDSNDEIQLEITDYENGNKYTHIYSVPYRPTHCNRKRLICFSMINNEDCCYGDNCTYAHSLKEQIIDDDKKFLYKIVLDKNLMNFFSLTNPKTDEIYKQLLFLTHLCENCVRNKCTGGYNCRYGVCINSLKLCKNDLLTGECLNKVIDIPIEPIIEDKMKDEDITFNNIYKGCINGHHLSERNLLPYYKYIHKKENTRKNRYESSRYIDINQINKIFRGNNNNTVVIGNKLDNSDTDSSTDEEISGWFKKRVTLNTSDENDENTENNDSSDNDNSWLQY